VFEQIASLLSSIVWSPALGLTAWINVLALLILCPQAIRAMREYEQSLKGSPRR
jgi:Na+/alanine symporter